jgi:hypothetical protein
LTLRQKRWRRIEGNTMRIYRLLILISGLLQSMISGHSHSRERL